MTAPDVDWVIGERDRCASRHEKLSRPTNNVGIR
jgi:hypothetical protein